MRFAGRASSLVLGAALAAILAWHVRVYWFLTDDAFISFRYARNWAEGHGLVFNPGGERVEGYTNFLWVVLLAAGAKLGIVAERTAPVLGVVATAAIWSGAAWFGCRRLLPAESRGWWWVAPAALAANRSFAVWATGGLETRLFELLVLAGLAVLWGETRAVPAGGRRGPSRAAALLGLAVLTRPDALAVVVGAALASEWQRARAGHWRARAMLHAWLPFIALVGGHLAWRLAYYGYPLPNTYYAKFGGRFAGDWGIQYVAQFALEYALPVWIPFWIAGARAWRDCAPGLGSIAAAGLLPYLLYVVWCGGDLFEFRPLDLLWVPLALLLQSGAARLATGRGAVWRAAVGGAVVGCVSLAALVPTLSHLDFPRDYVTGFPGVNGRPGGDQRLVRAEVAPRLLRPLLAPWLLPVNALARRLTTDLVGLRQEEHRRFVAETTASGFDLRDLVAEGIFPPDTRIALNCVGAVPYYSRLWTLDRIGLCDAHVAHQPRGPGKGRMAHVKRAQPEYIASRLVDVEPVLNYSLFAGDQVVRNAQDSPACDPPHECYVAQVGPDLNLLVRFPLGLAHGRARFPGIAFRPLRGPKLDSNAERPGHPTDTAHPVPPAGTSGR